MTDRVYPSTKPATNGTTATNPSFPATKAQQYGATRPAYRPTSYHERRRRGCCCSCCLWLTFTIITLLFLIAIAGAVIYVLYRPQSPNFSVSGLKVSTLNLTSSSMTLNVTARNPNKKLVYIYNPFSVSLYTVDGIAIGEGSFPSFVQDTKNTTLLRTAITSNNQQDDDASTSELKTDLNSKSGIAVKIQMDTKVKVQMGALKTPNVGLRVTCERIRLTVPTGKTATTASTSNAKCKIDVRIKIWKWTL
ncbi:LEA_2 domain-containing protein [Cephalotus follicularis]|uniref:LEA_2 domain-containing protein n=1 Tax=Cephalotus follicularis TaxID=3775 RepID=A0A1Q3DDM8_CEPFO|nr:LEA_2 domain-containing protein [Cephalotus follicularis]